MKHPETHLVTAENGPRSAGKADRCFYCPSAVGEEHAPDCVCRNRTVRVRASFTMIMRVPEAWTPHDIEFHLNRSSSCAGNVVDRLIDRQELNQCFCGEFEGAYLGEATAADDERWGFEVLKPQ